MIRRRQFLGALGAAALARLDTPAWARIGAIEIGICAHPRQLEDAVRYRFDYLEPGAAEIAEMDEPAFQSFRERVLASPIRCESFNSFVRKLRVVGEDAHEAELRDYVRKTLERCRQLGGKVVVWGSAGSRNLEPGYPRERGWEQVKSFLHMAGEIAKPLGLVIAIEPLRKQESNIINNGAEALKLVEEVGHRNVKMIIDYYHLRVENEDPQIVWEARKEIVHFHFANPNGRVWPKKPEEDPIYGRFFELVKKINFEGGISIEAKGNFDDDAAASLDFFKQELSS